MTKKVKKRPSSLSLDDVPEKRNNEGAFKISEVHDDKGKSSLSRKIIINNALAAYDNDNCKSAWCTYK